MRSYDYGTKLELVVSMVVYIPRREVQEKPQKVRHGYE